MLEEVEYNATARTVWKGVSILLCEYNSSELFCGRGTEISVARPWQVGRYIPYNFLFQASMLQSVPETILQEVLSPLPVGLVIDRKKYLAKND